MERLSSALRRAGALADALLADALLADALSPGRASPGALVPPGARAQTGAAESAQAECLLLPAVGATLAVRLRWTQLCALEPVGPDGPTPPRAAETRTVPRRLDVILSVAQLAEGVRRFPFAAPGRGWRLRAPDGARWLPRRGWPVSGALEVGAHRLTGARGALRVRVEVHNDVEWRAYDAPPALALRRALLGVHVLLAVTAGRFLSTVDPPGWARAAVADCVNAGMWPVLAGDPRTVLAAPVPLPDHPSAPVDRRAAAAVPTR